MGEPLTKNQLVPGIGGQEFDLNLLVQINLF